MTVSLAAVSSSTPERGNLPYLVSGFFTLLKASNNLLYLSVLTTFLETVGAASLPWVYLLVNLVFITFQFWFMAKIVGYEGHWLLSLVNWPAAALSFVAALVFPADTLPVLLCFLVLAMLNDLISTQAFTAMVNHFFTVAESRRFTPFIYASGSFGFIISGLLLKFVLDFVGIRGLLVVNGMVILTASLILHWLKPFEQSRLAELEESEQSEELPIVSKDAPAESSMQHPLARLLNVSSFLILFNKYLIDFLFAAAIAAYFTSGNDLAAFMGVFGASVDFVVIGLQTFVMHRVFAAFSIGKILLVMPLVLTVLCTAASFNPKFVLITVVQFLVLLNSKNFTVPATTILMGVIPQEQRVYYRRDMSVVCSISSTLVGIFLLLVRNRIAGEVLFLIAAGVYFLMAIAHYLIDQAYLTTLRRAIDKRQLDFGGDQVASLRFLQYDQRLQQLQQLLYDENSRVRSRAVEEVALLPTATASKLLLPLLEHEVDSRCLNAITRNLLEISPQASAEHIRKLLENTGDQRLRSDIIETIGRLRTPAIGEDFVLPFLDASHHRVRASAIISSIRLTRQPEILTRALRKLSEMADDAHDLMRASAAAVMGELGLPLFVPALATLSEASETVVAGNAAAALARIPTPDATLALEQLLAHNNREVAQRAENLLAVSTRESISRISRLLPGITTEERRKLTTRLRSGRHHDSQELLATILSVENVEQRRSLIALLEKADRETVALMQKTIIAGADERVTFSVAPLLELAEKHGNDSLPDWAPLMGVLAAGTLENPDDHRDLFDAACCLINMLWCERLILAGNDLATARQKWAGRAYSLARLLACFSKEPAPLVRSIDELKNGKAYARGMAAEYIEAKAGHYLAGMLIPLFDISVHLPDDYQQLVEFASEHGVVADAADLAAARLRLKNLEIIKENPV